MKNACEYFWCVGTLDVFWWSAGLWLIWCSPHHHNNAWAPPRAPSPWSPRAHDKHTMRRLECDCNTLHLHKISMPAALAPTFAHISLWRWMDQAVDLIYHLMNNVCYGNWIGLLDINVSSSISAGSARTVDQIKSHHPCAHVGTNSLMSSNLYTWW